MNKYYLACALLFGLTATAHPRNHRTGGFSGDIPDTVDDLDVSQYIGRWYQMYSDNVIINTFERNAVCITADYGVYNETTVTVYNADRYETPDGELREIHGYAYTTDAPGKFRVVLERGVPAPYWVLQLGPVENGQYQYSIVSDEFKLGLFVLARDVDDFNQRFDANVTMWLEENGFSGILNSPIATYQGSDCMYAEPPTH